MSTYNEALRSAILNRFENVPFTLLHADLLKDALHAKESIGALAGIVSGIFDMLDVDLHGTQISSLAELARSRMQATLEKAEGLVRELGELNGPDSEGLPSIDRPFNEVFNADLRVVVDDKSSLASIRFRQLEPPFPLTCPFVTEYVVFFVKAAMQESFTIAEAEQLILEGADLIKIPPDAGQAFLSAPLADARDTDGEPLVPGEHYSAFLLALYGEDYKKLINNFDEWFSVPVRFTYGQGLSEAVSSNSTTSDRQAAGILSTLKSLCDKTIFSAELINKLSNTVIRKKALNPLISDVLIGKLFRAENAANSAVAAVMGIIRSQGSVSRGQGPDNF